MTSSLELICWSGTDFNKQMIEGMSDVANVVFGEGNQNETEALNKGADDYIDLTSTDRGAAEIRIRNAVEGRKVSRESYKQLWSNFEEKYSSHYNVLFLSELDIKTGKIKQIKISETAREKFYNLQEYKKEPQDQQLLHPEDMQKIIDFLSPEALRAMAESCVHEGREQFRIKDRKGFWVWVESRISFEKDVFGRYRCFNLVQILGSEDFQKEIYYQTIKDTVFDLIVFKPKEDICWEVVRDGEPVREFPKAYSSNYENILKKFVAKEDLTGVLGDFNPKVIKERLSKEKSYSGYYAMEGFDHRKIRILYEISCLEDNQDVVIIVHKDVTDFYEKIEESRKRDIEALINNNTGGVIAISVEDKKIVPLRYSEAICRLIDYSEEELMAMTSEKGFNCLVHPDDLEKVREAEEKLVHDKEDISVVFRMQKRDGSFIWLEGTGNFAKGTGGSEVYYLSFGKAEQLKRMEAAISQQEKLISEILYFSDVDYFEYDFETGICRLGGLTRKRYGIPKEIHDFKHHVLTGPVMYKDHRQLFIDMLSAAENSKTAPRCEVKMKSAETGKFIWMRYQALAVHDEYGKAFKIIGIGIKIDEFMEIQRRFNRAVVQNGIGTWVLNIPYGSVTQISDFGEEDPFGSSNQYIENVVDSVIGEGKIFSEDIEKYRSMYERVIAGEESVKDRIRHWSEIKQDFCWYEYNFSLIEKEGLKPLSAIITVRDISAEKTMEEYFQRELANREVLDEHSIAYCRINITRRIIEDITISDMAEVMAEDQTLLDFKERFNLYFEGTDLSEEELQELSIEGLKGLYQEGKREVTKCYWAVLKTTGKQAWIQTDVKLVVRQETGELIAFFYNRDLTHEHLLEGMMKDLAKHSYERSGAIFARDNYLRPILELNDGYLRDWIDGNYDEGVKRYCSRCIPESMRNEVYRKMKLETVVEKLNEGEAYQVQYDYILPEGGLGRKETSYSYLDKENKVILISRTDIALYEELRYASEHDSLTGLYNRNKFFEEARKVVKNNPDTTFVFLQIDIDRFKLYNSAFGTEEGDQLLKYTADLLVSTIPFYHHYVYGRLQSDVFCLCAAYDIMALRKSLRYVNRKISEYRSDYLLRFSFGLCIMNDPSLTLEEASMRAAIAAKKCKEDINKAFEVYDDSEEVQQRTELEITNTMHTALLEKQFVVYLQPKYELKGETPNGAEALVRWISPEKGMISPGLFIPVFEGNGFIANLDQYMWEEVCILLRRWIDEGYQPAPVSVNISRISLYNPNLVRILKKLVQKYGISPELLHLEITESAYMSNEAMMQNIIDQLHGAGFVILMDDFGSGYSSLNTLKEFHIDILKIDMNFLPKDKDIKRAEIILASMIRMAKWLGMEVIMEGVETEEQCTFLRAMECDMVQGYYFARPMKVEDYEKNYVYNFKESVPLGDYGKNEAKGDREILIIEDDDYTNKIIRKSLENQYNLVIFNSAEEGLEYLQSHRNTVGLIIIDGILPGMYGLDFLEYCSQEPDFGKIPKIYFDDEFNMDNHVRAIELGVSNYLVKPMDIEVLRYYAAKLINITFMDVAAQQKSIERERLLLKCNQLIGRNPARAADSKVGMLILKYYEADRIYLFKFDWNKGTISKALEYTAEGIEAIPGETRDIKIERNVGWEDRLRRGELIFIDDVEVLAGDPLRKKEYEYLCRAGIKRWIVVPVIYEEHIMGFIGIDNPRENVYDVDFLNNVTYFVANNLHEKELKEALIKMAHTDSLTLLKNRNAYNELLEVSKEQRLHNTGVAFADVNGLKRINDNKGHMTGDVMIREAAEVLKHYFGEDSIYRISGDEFVVVKEEILEEDFEAIKESFLKDEKMAEKPVLSLGSIWKNQIDNLQEAVCEAEKKMYEIKRAFYINNPYLNRRGS